MVLHSAVRACFRIVSSPGTMVRGILAKHVVALHAMPMPRDASIPGAAPAAAAGHDSGDEVDARTSAPAAVALAASTSNGADVSPSALCAGLASLQVGSGTTPGPEAAERASAASAQPNIALVEGSHSSIGAGPSQGASASRSAQVAAAIDERLAAFFVLLQTTAREHLSLLDRLLAARRRAAASAPATAKKPSEDEATGLAGVTASGATDIDSMQARPSSNYPAVGASIMFVLHSLCNTNSRSD
jgi:hypothetical protein